MRIFRDLQHRGVLSVQFYQDSRTRRVCNRAAHGAHVGPQATKWATEFGPRVLAVLDKHLDDGDSV